MVHKIIEVPFAPLDQRFDPIFSNLLDKLLNKNAFLRASVTEIIEMAELADRVERFQKYNEDYLAAMHGARQQQELLMTRARSAMHGVINRPAREALREEHSGSELLQQIEDVTSNEPPFDQIMMGDINVFQKHRSTGLHYPQSMPEPQSQTTNLVQRKMK